MTHNYIHGFGILIYLINKLSRVKPVPALTELSVGIVICDMYSGVKAKIKEINIDKNQLFVECKNLNGNVWSEEWNLANTKWRFDKDLYYIDNNF